MTRSLGLASACVLAGLIGLSAQQSRPPARGGGPAGTPQPKGQSPATGNQQNPELQQAREALQRDVAEGKRLQEQLKLDRKAGDKEAVKRDNEALKENRENVKRDQDRIRQLQSARGRGRGRV
jgi:hypothetical protein